MKEKQIKIIIGLMAFAVIGLIAIQIYWLTNLIKVEEEKFNRNVSAAIVSAAGKLERDEAVKKTLSTVFVRNNANNKAPQKDVLINVTVKDTNQKFGVVRWVDHDSTKFTSRIANDSVSIKAEKLLVRGMPILIKDGKVKPPQFVYQGKIDTLIVRKKNLVQNVVTEMMRITTILPIEKRLNVKTIDSVLIQEFSSRGIRGEFQFGVYKSAQDSFVLLKKLSDEITLKKSNNKTPLFPEEFFSEVNELTVYFPNKSSSIFASVAGMLALSIGFIALIVATFWKTVQLFIKQKKITEVKNDLINNITHEFKTPIATISLACEALNEPALSSEKNSVSRYSKIIKEENERLQLMVDTLLNTASLERDEITLERSQIDLLTIIKSSVSKFDEVIRLRSGNIFVESSEQTTEILGDKFHLTNVFSNLIDNAIKFCEKNPEIKIILNPTEENVELTFTDNGIGIEEEYFSKIFETFYRVQSGNIQNTRGNGIGLSYVKKIIELHGGRISVQSKINFGTTITISLPKQ